MLTVSEAPFGVLPDGRAATLFTLTNTNGLVVKLSDYGGIITAIHTPDKHGEFADVTLGFDNLNDYVEKSPYFGALIGRYGNRIGKARFSLNGITYQLNVNDGVNHLHGGAAGLDKVLWQAQTFSQSRSVGITLSYFSRDGEQGYPGNLQIIARYELTEHNELIIKFHAVTDQATPVNLTNHAYFNLAGHGDILAHELCVDADTYTLIDSALIPTGELVAVADTPLDFRRPCPIGKHINLKHPQLIYGSGYDHNFVLNPRLGQPRRLAATVHERNSGRVLEVFSDQPGLQFYSGNFLDGTLTGKHGAYQHRSGFCLEPQHFPDSPNKPHFPTTILRPGEQYAHTMAYQFSTRA